MATATLDEIQLDGVAMSIARAVRLANETAQTHGTRPLDSLITISEETTSDGRQWRIHYGARDFVNHRGGDLIVLIDEHGDAVQSVLRGQ